MVTFLFIQKLVEDFRRRSTCGNQRQNGSRQAVFLIFVFMDILNIQPLSQAH
ncbi:hypothetical protein SS52_3087 [Escherichia coli O157:H7 str. SS52]|nr:hypothetical protein SS52_3087 [Escherichia coli O157:H7 str. SS52]